MAITSVNRNELFVVSPLEALVPEDHLVRKLEEYVDWSFIYKLTDHLYSDYGRGRIDPVILFKMIFINKIFGINSMRRTCEEIKVNVAYRWFLNIGFDEPVPNHSTYSQNYRRKFKDAGVIERIFYEVIKQLNDRKLLDLEAVFIDGTHIKAHANKNSYTKEERIKIATKIYQKELDQEIDLDRKNHGKKSLKKKEPIEESKLQKVSKNDPESGVFHKGEKEKCFAYSANTACDKNGYILGTYVTAGNIHDSTSFYGIYEELRKLYSFKNTSFLAADAGYITPHICKTIIEDEMTPLLPYKRPMTKKGYFKKYEYVYDEEFDCYICPEGKTLNYSTTNREGYKEYKSREYNCKDCPVKEKCTTMKYKVVTRHVWEEYKEEAVDHIRHTKEWKDWYPKRKETIERCFADAKMKHGIGFTRYKGRARVTDDVLLVFASMNLKKMVNYLSKIGASPSIIIKNIENYIIFLGYDLFHSSLI